MKNANAERIADEIRQLPIGEQECAVEMILLAAHIILDEKSHPVRPVVLLQPPFARN